MPATKPAAELSLEPADTGPSTGITPFTQTIHLRAADGDTIAAATWTCGDVAAGVVQIVSLNVAKSHQRQGHGTRLLHAMIEQSSACFLQRKSRLRRLWTAVAQKSQVNARAFATSRGFTHVGTVQELLRDQDLLIYMRTFD